MATTFVGKEINYQEYPYSSFIGTIQVLRAITTQTSVWGLCVESPARQGFEDFESPLRQWFTMNDALTQDALQMFSIGDKVKVHSYGDDSVARIEKVEA